MTAFSLPIGPAKPLLAVVAAHGLTDLDSWDWAPHYAFWLLLPLPSPAVTALFCASSLSHLTAELGDVGSFVLHAGLAVTAAQCGELAAFNVMLAYLAFVHVPAHYRRCLQRGRRPGALAAAAVGGLAACLSHTTGSTFVFGNRMQRVAIAHICHEYVLEQAR